MHIRVLRIDGDAERTIGLMVVDGVFTNYTLEDPVRTGPKIPGKTAIPIGRYEVTITHSQRFDRPLPLLLDVPDFSGIRIHAGNTAADTSGCILVGISRGPDAVLESLSALALLQREIRRALEAGDHVWCAVDNVL